MSWGRITINKVFNVLIQRVTFFWMTKTKSMGLESMKANNEVDKDFVDARTTLKKPWIGDRTPYFDYFIQEGYLLKENRLRVPRG